MPVLPDARRRYSNSRLVQTSFGGTENPITESGLWICGGTDGLDWQNMRKTPGLAFGTQTGNSGQYDDSVALLTGPWGRRQRVKGTVKTVNQQTGTCYEEVEGWLRGEILGHSIKGYETAFRCNHDGSQYIGIVKWLGTLGSFIQLGSNVAGPGLFDGDTVEVRIVAEDATSVTVGAYINGVLIVTQTDSSNPYRTGAPGMGHWLRLNGATGVSLDDYGFTSFEAYADEYAA